MSITQSGTYLTGIDALSQSLSLFFKTPKGSVPLHPRLGHSVKDKIDRNIADLLQLIRDINNGLALWDTRITVIRITPTFDQHGKLKIGVRWRPTEAPTNIINSEF